jgi:dTMP kinase
MIKRGKFIVLEGGDAAGKGTLVRHLQQVLSQRQFIYSREPGGTPIGEKIRDLLLNEEMSPATELGLHFAYRFELFEKVIIPALDRGINVIDERHVASTYAYQIGGRERRDLLPLFRSNERACEKYVRPDLYIYLDLDPKEGDRRLKAKGEKLDRFELAGFAFHERVRRAYHKYFRNRKHITLDASKKPEVLCKEIERIIRAEVAN